MDENAKTPYTNVEQPQPVDSLPQAIPTKLIFITITVLVIVGMGVFLIGKNISANNISSTPSPTPTISPNLINTGVKCTNNVDCKDLPCAPVGFCPIYTCQQGYCYEDDAPGNPLITGIYLTQAADPMRSWMTYKSAQYGFSIKYPTDVHVEEIKNGDKESSVSFSKVGPSQKKQAEPYDGIYLRATLYTLNGNTLKESLDTDLKSSATDPVVLEPLSEVEVNGIKAYRMKIQGLGIFTNYYFDKGNGQYLIISDSSNDPTGQGYTDIVTQILSTIRLIY